MAQLDAGNKTEYENVLNNSSIKDLDDLAALLKSDGATITEKSCKFVVGDIIGHHDNVEIGRFLKGLSTTQLLQLYGALVANGYIFNSRYALEIKSIKEEICLR